MIPKQDVNMTLLVVRMVVLLIGRSTSRGSTVWLNSPVVEESLCFISRVSHSPSPPPNIICCPCKVLSTSSPSNHQSEGNGNARDGRF